MQVLHADVDVELDVVDRNNKPPVWDANVYGPIHIKENVTVGTVVTSVKARFVCHDMTETRHVTCRAVPCIADSLFAFCLSFYRSFVTLLRPSLLPFCSTSPICRCVCPFVTVASHSSSYRFASLRHSTVWFTCVIFYTSRSWFVFFPPTFFSNVPCFFLAHTWCILRELRHVWLSAAR